MFAQRSAQQALRRFAAGNPTLASQMIARKSLAPIAVAGSMQTRFASSEKLSTAESYQILVNQRKQRPVSPHLAIYRPQVTWYLSGLNRITGLMLSGPFYLFGLTYLAAPLFGWHLDSATLAATVASWPAFVTGSAKFLMAWPFTFHSFNGIRYLLWDTGRTLTNKQVIRTGWTAVGLSFVSAVYLAFLW